MNISAPAAAGVPAPAIELHRLVRRFGREQVLRGVSLQIAPGRLVALMGRNGSGKTTLLRVLATRLRPNGGRGAVFGHDLARDAAAVRRRCAYLSVQGGAFLALSGRENLRLTATLAGAPRDRVEQALGTVGLERHGDRPVRVYSSGMKRRLGLASLLLRDADLWLLDEPYVSLDEDGRALVDRMLDDAKAKGRTVLLATHEPERMATRADAVVTIEQGQLLPEERDQGATRTMRTLERTP